MEEVLVSDAGSSIRVGQAASGNLSIDSGAKARSYEVRNVRCMYGCCHGAPCAYWVVRNDE
jgi:hypothetical protein